VVNIGTYSGTFLHDQALRNQPMYGMTVEDGSGNIAYATREGQTFNTPDGNLLAYWIIDEDGNAVIYSQATHEVVDTVEL